MDELAKTHFQGLALSTPLVSPGVKGIVKLQIKILMDFYEEDAGITWPFPKFKILYSKAKCVCIYVCIYCTAFLLHQRYFLTFCLFYLNETIIMAKEIAAFFFLFLCNRKACF